MAYDEIVSSITLPAASGIAVKTGVSGVDTATSGDVGGKQYFFVKVDSSGNAALAAGGTSEVVLGVLQNKPQVTGQAATVARAGVSKVVLGGTVAAGDAVKVDSNGNAIKYGTLATDKAAGILVGVALKGGAAGAIVPVALTIT